jgi:hypothetical protein
MCVYILSLTIPRMKVKINHPISISINSKYWGIVSCHESLGLRSAFLTNNESSMTNDEWLITAY